MEIKIFEKEEFGSIRTILTEKGEVLFLAQDVCSILDISNVSDAISRLDDDEKLTSVLPISGQNRNVNMVNESGLYSLVFKSRKDSAKSFKKWVTKDVLPSIRKTGSYSLQFKLPETYVEALRALADSEEEKQKALSMVAEKESVIEEQGPKVDFAERFITSDDLIEVGMFAKVLTQNGFSIGRNTLFELMKAFGLVFKNGQDKWEPYQKFSPKVMKVKETAFLKPDGVTGLNQQVLITAHGQALIIKYIFKTRRDIAEKFGNFEKLTENPFD